MKKKGVEIYWLIFAGMILGVIMGMIAVEIDAMQLIKNWIAPIGDIFVKLLNLIAIPLLFVSLVRGIINLGSTTKLVSIGWRTIVLYTATTVVATLFAILLVLTIKPGEMVSTEGAHEHFGMFELQASSTIQGASDFADRSPLAPVVDMIPDNIVTALSGSSGMLQALVLALFLGLAMASIKDNKLQPMRDLLADADALLSHCVELTMYIAPIGIMALMANVVVDSNGDGELLRALGLYSLTTVGGIICFAFIFYPILIAFFTKIKVRDYITAVLPIQLMAISTSSSAATLPTTMNVANNKLGIPKSVTSFTLPMGVTINMDGSSIYITITVIFIAQVMNIDLTFAQIMTVIFTSLIASVGTPGVPGGVLMTVVMVLGSIGIPLESLALVIALVRPIDMFVTALNVTGDVAISAVVANGLNDK